jgi:hypothetical protein
MSNVKFEVRLVADVPEDAIAWASSLLPGFSREDVLRDGLAELTRTVAEEFAGKTPSGYITVGAERITDHDHEVSVA